MKKNVFVRGMLFTPVIFAFSMSFAQNNEQSIRDYINTNLQLKNLPSELKDFNIINSDPSQSLTGNVVVVQQKINGLPVYNKTSTFLIKNNKVEHATQGFLANILTKDIPNAQPKNSAEKAFGTFLSFSKIGNSASYRLSNNKGENAVASKLIYFQKGNSLRLAYEFLFDEIGSINTWQVIVDANSSEILTVENKTLSEHLHAGLFSSDDDGIHGKKTVAYPLNQNSQTIDKFTASNATYNVYALPLESPLQGNRSIVSNPWILSSSPEGWQSDGTNNYTVTRGNNVHAYTDESSNNQVGETADGGANLNFDFPLDVNQPATAYTKAAITNLFYMNNMMHDIFYKYGFTESARNFQTNNFNKGGVGNDAVLAEARDGGGTNNANFQSPADGTSPRMQMYLWDPKNINGLDVNAPSDLTSLKPNTRFASFGNALTATGITGDLIVANPLRGCGPITNSLTGKVALIERGDCDFVVKVKNAQTAGAKAVVIYNNSASINQLTMSGTDDSVTISSVLIPFNDGTVLKNKLGANVGVNVTLKNDVSKNINLDGSLDNGIIAHEYGHGISNRLTGLGDGNCLSYTTDNEQMGEGWSDFFALMLTLKPTDNASIAKGIGTFAAGQEATGVGIRPAKYSPDFAINNYTYGKTNGMTAQSSFFGFIPITVADVHSVGFVWATMLWDLNWKYAAKYGYNNDIVSAPNSGPAKMLQVVVDALKFQPCNPTFVQGRDAIIAADQAQTGGENKCMIWEAFAKRGLGVNAAPGGLEGMWWEANSPAPELNDQVEDFQVPAECKLATQETSSTVSVKLYPNPAKNELFIKAGNASSNAFVKIYDVSGKLVKEQRVNVASGESINVSDLPNGMYVVKGDGIGVNFTEKVIIKK